MRAAGRDGRHDPSPPQRGASRDDAAAVNRWVGLLAALFVPSHARASQTATATAVPSAALPDPQRDVVAVIGDSLSENAYLPHAERQSLGPQLREALTRRGVDPGAGGFMPAHPATLSGMSAPIADWPVRYSGQWVTTARRRLGARKLVERPARHRQRRRPSPRGSRARRGARSLTRARTAACADPCRSVGSATAGARRLRKGPGHRRGERRATPLDRLAAQPVLKQLGARIDSASVPPGLAILAGDDPQVRHRLGRFQRRFLPRWRRRAPPWCRVGRSSPRPA